MKGSNMTDKTWKNDERKATLEKVDAQKIKGTINSYNQAIKIIKKADEKKK
ncbi:MAG: hypothetical protein GYA62_15050 [Bacteroidales bacterium]|nr:hypothetical protein [Bacteroidales bacterium]